MADSFRIVPLDASTAIPAVDVTCDAFDADEKYSWARVLQRGPFDLREYLIEDHVPSLLGKQPPSLVALGPGGEVLGVLLLQEDWHQEVFDTYDGPDKALHAIVSIMRAGGDTFHAALKERGLPLDTRSAYVSFLATATGSQRRGVAQKLLVQCVDSVKEAGFPLAWALCTSPKSTALFAKHGFERWGEIVYRDLDVDGKRPFDLPDGMTIMARTFEAA
ncbi:hypothetical protein DFJ74DRAFT_665287 [Hyaloraphidium curvatum]|nr:hypothetical protein DFJ74DRAFT_665287 [Hyaloraphidium curvatum]